MDVLDRMMAYENGELSQEDVIDLFQHLLNSGRVWQLQGHYGRMVKWLIEAGYIEPEEVA
jgi:hypothetical protein